MKFYTPNQEEMNIIKNEDFIKTISALNVCLEEREKMIKILENRKIHVERYQRHLQKIVNYDIRKDKLIPLEINLEHNLKFCNGLCLSHINTLRDLVDI